MFTGHITKRNKVKSLKMKKISGVKIGLDELFTWLLMSPDKSREREKDHKSGGKACDIYVR